MRSPIGSIALATALTVLISAESGLPPRGRSWSSAPMPPARASIPRPRRPWAGIRAPRSVNSGRTSSCSPQPSGRRSSSRRARHLASSPTSCRSRPTCSVRPGRPSSSATSRAPSTPRPGTTRRWLTSSPGRSEPRILRHPGAPSAPTSSSTLASTTTRGSWSTSSRWCCTRWVTGWGSPTSSTRLDGTTTSRTR